jgi:sugar phosphate isomerase/epimerase
MDVGISTRCFGTAPLTLDLLQRLYRAEFTQIELHASLPGLNYHNRSVVRDIARWFRENELPAPSLHLPFEMDILSNSQFERQAARDEFKRCLELNDILPLRFAVLHLGGPLQEFNPVVFEHAYAAVATIQSFSGVRVLFETLRNGVATFARIKEFRHAAELPDLGICYDTGHGEMDGPCDAIHLNETSAEEDSHLWPFEGHRDWPRLVERLVLSAYNGPMILEVADDKLEKAGSCRSRLGDLMDEAADSIEEFRLRYKLPAPLTEEDES